MDQIKNPHRDTIVHTSLGDLQGIIEEGVIAFHGVPYAQPPVGPRRLRGPAPLEPWQGIRIAIKSGPASYQLNSTNREKVLKLVKSFDLGSKGIHPRPDYSQATYEPTDMSEDCLYLEIWVPGGAIKAGAKLPVYMYYHGGANAASSGASKNETGNNLAQEENIIVVRPTYRSGFLGWGNFGLVSDLYPEAINLGLQDQIAALQFVHQHIESFGGDKDNITVAGESAGGVAVAGLLTYPPTQPLIKRAIIQSLCPYHAWSTQEKTDAIAVVEMFLQLLEIDDPAELATLDPDYFVVAHSILSKLFHPDRNCAWSPVGPVIDGNFVLANPVVYLSQETYPRKDFELMIGFAKDEWQYSRGQSHTSQHGTKAEVIAVFAQVFGQEKAARLYQDYRKLYPTHEKPGHTLGDVMTMEFFKLSGLLIAQNFAAKGFPTYAFQFSLDLPGYGGWLRAVHTGDCPIIFRNVTDQNALSHFPGYDGLDRAMLRRIATEFGSMYASFIRGGEPGNYWKKFDINTRGVFWLAEECKFVDHLFDGEVEAFRRAGIQDFKALQNILLRNTRRSLNTRQRAFAIGNGL